MENIKQQLERLAKIITDRAEKINGGNGGAGVYSETVDRVNLESAKSLEILARTLKMLEQDELPFTQIKNINVSENDIVVFTLDKPLPQHIRDIYQSTLKNYLGTKVLIIEQGVKLETVLAAEKLKPGDVVKKVDKNDDTRCSECPCAYPIDTFNVDEHGQSICPMCSKAYKKINGKWELLLTPPKDENIFYAIGKTDDGITPKYLHFDEYDTVSPMDSFKNKSIVMKVFSNKDNADKECKRIFDTHNEVCGVESIHISAFKGIKFKVADEINE